VRIGRVERPKAVPRPDLPSDGSLQKNQRPGAVRRAAG
jgi:hypothetical protein